MKTNSVVEELLAGLLNLSTLFGRLVLKDPSGLEEGLSDVGVEGGEPLSELGVLLGLTKRKNGRCAVSRTPSIAMRARRKTNVKVNVVDGVDDAVHRLSVGKSLEEGLELLISGLESSVRSDGASRVLSNVGKLLGVTLVVLGLVEEEVDS
jgi:hypothetical protein